MIWLRKLINKLRRKDKMATCTRCGKPSQINVDVDGSGNRKPFCTMTCARIFMGHSEPEKIKKQEKREYEFKVTLKCSGEIAGDFRESLDNFCEYYEYDDHETESYDSDDLEIKSRRV